MLIKFRVIFKTKGMIAENEATFQGFMYKHLGLEFRWMKLVNVHVNLIAFNLLPVRVFHCVYFYASVQVEQSKHAQT